MDTRACRPGYDHYKWCNTSLSKAERLEALIQELRDDEIPPLLTARQTQTSAPRNVTRLGIPTYDWGANCIHGVQSSCVSDGKTTYCPTSFPNPVNLGSAWNKTMWQTMGSVIGLETRALWLAGATEYAGHSLYIGLDCWSPNININHDPRWGRNQEVPSEDPYINGLFGALVTVGLQRSEKDKRYVQAINTIKHWDAYTLENSDGYSRHNFNAVTDNATLSDTFFPAWRQTIVEGNALGVMCSYNALNGVPTCASSFLKSVLRGTWNFTGYVTSDSGAVRDIYAQHHYVSTAPEAACVALREGGTDINSGGVYSSSLLDGVREGHCSRDDINTALRNTYGLLFDMGLFDPVEDQPMWHVKPTEVGTDNSKSLSALAARESMVLLKNEGQTLPFAKGKSVAVIGPHSNATRELVGNYIGQICPEDGFDCVETPSAAIGRYASKVTVAEGCTLDGTSKAGFDEAIAAAKAADQVVLTIGIGLSVENEGHDRTSIDLPGVQGDLVSAILELKKPTVVVLVNGGMVSLGDLRHSIPALVEAFYPGVYGSQAIASTIFGENENLGGKMPYTVYPANYTSTVKLSVMSMNSPSTLGRSYKYYTGEPEYEFGFGLSLTSWKLQAPASTTLTFSCEGKESTDSHITWSATNTGSVTGDDVWQVYGVGGKTGSGLPLKKRLVAFTRIHATPGSTQTITLPVNREAFAVINDAGNRLCVPGSSYSVLVTNGNGLSFTLPVRLTGTETTIKTFPEV